MSQDAPSGSVTPPEPVLLREVLQHWVPTGKLGEMALVDATVGTGAYSERLLEIYPLARLLAVDVDAEALALARQRLDRFGERVSYYHGSFAHLRDALRLYGFPRRVDGIFADLGIGALQLESPERGFSFMRDGPLDMRYDTTRGITASDIVNKWSAEQLEAVFREHGDEELADVAAAGIVRWRGRGQRQRKIVSTLELRHAIESAVAAHEGALAPSEKHGDKVGQWASRARRERALKRLANTHPKHSMVVRRCFQALRVAVNRETEHLEHFLDAVHEHLAPGGRCVVVSSQPAQDDPVQQTMAWLGAHCMGSVAEGAPDCLCGTGASFEHLTPEAIRAPRLEVKRNRRARSAHMRVLECRCAHLPLRPDEEVLLGDGDRVAPSDDSTAILSASTVHGRGAVGATGAFAQSESRWAPAKGDGGAGGGDGGSFDPLTAMKELLGYLELGDLDAERVLAARDGDLDGIVDDIIERVGVDELGKALGVADDAGDLDIA